MTNIRRALEAAAAGGGDPVYVEDVFFTNLYRGNNGSQTVTNGIDLDGEGGMVWQKGTSTSQNHVVSDSERGKSGSNYKDLHTNLTDEENTNASPISAFNSNGFSMDRSGEANDGGDGYVSWTFRKKAKFFTMVKFTADATFDIIAHDLGSMPGFVVYKCLTSETDVTGGDWQAWHSSLDNNDSLVLNTNAAEVSSAGYIGDVTSTQCQFYCTSGETYIAYYFGNAEAVFGADGDQSIIKCGSYVGDGTETEIDLGWEAQWVIAKRITTTGFWFITDAQRNGGELSLSADTNSGNDSNPEIEFTQSGFKPKSNLDTSATFVYIAIRRPMKTPEAGTEVFSPVAYSGADGSTQVLTLSMSPDVTTIKIRNNATRPGLIHNRSDGGDFFQTSSANGLASASDNIVHFDYADNQIQLPAGSGTNEVNGASSSTYICEAFKRAPGFLDVMRWTGTGVARTVAHNLGVAPEMMWVKKRSSGNWAVYADNDPTDYGRLNSSNMFYDNADYWNDTAPTASVFTVGIHNLTNASGDDYQGYLWASVDGVSKVGSYTGTGADHNINCGFTARFVMVKRKDSGGNWIYLDSARGLTSTPTEPFLRYDTTDSEITWDDYIRGHADGFSVIGSGGDVNASGGTYIYLAIA